MTRRKAEGEMIPDKNGEENVEYDGFSTPCFILDGSDTTNKGYIVDRYAKTKDCDGLICGTWSISFEDKLIHIYLSKPVEALCNERDEWIVKKMLLKEPVSSVPSDYQIRAKSVKKEPEIDIEAGVIKW